jgi:hypothetical protein
MIRMNRLKILRILIIFAVSVFTNAAYARYYPPKSFFVTAQVVQLNDVGSTATSAESLLFPKQVTQAEVGLRLMNIFSISAIGQNGGEGDDQSIQGYGLGIRVDLPGFFLIGASDSQLRRKSKAYPVNSSIFMQSISTQYEQGTAVTKTVASRYGATVEIFPFQTLMYFSLEAGIYNFAGNSFAMTGAGLGLQF